jgi:hypothetical protein
MVSGKNESNTSVSKDDESSAELNTVSTQGLLRDIMHFDPILVHFGLLLLQESQAEIRDTEAV